MNERVIKRKMLCSVDGCRDAVYAKGLCGIHYRKNLAYGNPLEADRRRSSGSGSINPAGYMVKTINDKRVYEHKIIAEKALGRSLPHSAVVHHINGNKSDNRNENLLICPDQNYHHLLHRRTRALEACGNANFLHCRFCKQYDDPKNLYHQPRYAHHVKCSKKYWSDRYKSKVEKQAMAI